MEKKSRILQLIEILNKANESYEKGDEIISNFEYDKLYDELQSLEKSTGIILSNSPTQNVGYEIISSLPKEKHNKKMLSLDKTKNIEDLVDWLGDAQAILSWKLDGLTVVLTYENGTLLKAVTRGNGEIGEVITPSARVFDNLPIKIPFTGKLTVRGEAVISYSDFEKINESIEEVESKYKNPRNLCSGTVRQLSTQITKSRNVQFFAFGLIEIDDAVFEKRGEELDFIAQNGFATVDHKEVNKENIRQIIIEFENKIVDYDIPSDGLVIVFDDIAYSKSLGETSKFPKDSIAFKWKDQTTLTILREIEWSPSRTGLINPIAVFDEVELEGTAVKRASVHNISIVEDLQLGIGDEIEVYKANMIIPQILQNMTRSANINIIEKCPVCNSETLIKNENGIRTLHCPNENCSAKGIKKFSHFVSRNALNIEGLSESSLEKFIEVGIIKKLDDVFNIKNHEDTVVAIEGFGKKSFDNLVESIEKSRHATPATLLYSLGVPNIGVANAKLIAKNAGNDWKKMIQLQESELIEIDGVGDVMARAYREFFDQDTNKELISRLVEHVILDENIEDTSSVLAGQTFVITGSLNMYDNRDELVRVIENAGGKVTSSVSSSTNYLINNDTQSNSSKNKKAKEIGIPIINEIMFKEMLS